MFWLFAREVFQKKKRFLKSRNKTFLSFFFYLGWGIFCLFGFFFYIFMDYTLLQQHFSVQVSNFWVCWKFNLFFFSQRFSIILRLSTQVWKLSVVFYYLLEYFPKPQLSIFPSCLTTVCIMSLLKFCLSAVTWANHFTKGRDIEGTKTKTKKVMVHHCYDNQDAK